MNIVNVAGAVKTGRRELWRTDESIGLTTPFKIEGKRCRRHEAAAGSWSDRPSGGCTFEDTCQRRWPSCPGSGVGKDLGLGNKSRMVAVLTPMAMLTTSLTPMSPRVASTTSGGRPKTVRTNYQRPFEATGYLLELTSLSDLVDARVLVVESSNKSEWIASGVDLIVDGSLGEDRSLTRG